MREKMEKNGQETERALAFAMIFLNLLILVMVGAAGWLLREMIFNNPQLQTFLRGVFLQ